jgi:aubergine-like protein
MEEKKQESAILSKQPCRGPLLRTNMSKLNIKVDKVYQYAVEFSPKVDDSLTSKKHKIIKGAAKDLAAKLNYYIDLGNNVYSLKSVSSFKVTSLIKAEDTKIHYDCEVSFTKAIALNDLDSEGIQEIEMVFNIFLKKVMETQKLFPLRRNHFFDPGMISDIPDTNHCIASGYFASISALKDGLFLTIDTVNEIFKKTTCLDDITAMHLEGQTNDEIAQYFRLKRVSVFYSKVKTVTVAGIDFNLNPESKIEGQEETVAALYKKKYGLETRSPTQPLMYFKRNKEKQYIIPEFCYLKGLEDESRQCSKIMMELAMHCTKPSDKISQINEMFSKLLKTKAFDQCGLQLAGPPIQVPIKMLPSPGISNAPRNYVNPQDLSKGIKIMQPQHFENWLLIYEAKNYDGAGMLLNSMQKASVSLGIRIEEPEWLEVQTMNEKEIRAYLTRPKAPNFKFVLCLISNRGDYVRVKRLLEVDLGIRSQFVLNMYKKLSSLSIVSNIVKQINIKLGGESYKVDLPKEIPQNTMLVGIDVCHCGNQSIVGFYSNACSTMSTCFCDTAPQKKGKEIISILVPFYQKALETYLKQQKKLPEYILIFRDGVGNRQRKQVLSMELPQVIEAIKNFQGGYSPNITLVLVNKRIHQRLIKETQGQFYNPIPGTLVDDYITEKDCNNFYLVSAVARVGTVKPTHYYIAYNDKKSITTEVIQSVAFATSYMYYNSSSSVKVPAHITLADKKANLISILKGNSHEKLRCSQSFV